MPAPRQRKPPTRIWIARHGQTESNRAGVFCGHSETPLTGLGREQARALGRRLASVEIRALYTSDYSRAMDTAAIALAGRGIQPSVDPDLRELHYGAWEMQREREIRRTPEHAAQFELMRREDPSWQPPGGETTAAVRARTFAALQRMAKRHRNEDVLVVSHGTAINCLIAEVLGMAPTHVFRFAVANCGLSCVTVTGGRLVVTLLNETAHLEGIAVPGQGR
jgi:alpha-ribazole phosphatase/probable phosphoglycerate mutase